MFSFLKKIFGSSEPVATPVTPEVAKVEAANAVPVVTEVAAAPATKPAKATKPKAAPKAKAPAKEKAPAKKTAKKSTKPKA
jgi:hypothetical protein